MDFILGVLAFMQITIIPGLIVLSFSRFRTNLLDKILIVFAASLIANYCALFLFSALGIYTRIIFGLLIAAELIAILWLYRKALVTPVKTVLEAGQDGLYEISNLFFRGRGQGSSVLYYFVVLILLLFSAGSILWGFSLFLYRLHDPREWLDAGFRDVSGGHAVSLIEWPEKAAGWLPPPDVIIRLTIADDAREIECEAASPRGAHYLETCCTLC